MDLPVFLNSSSMGYVFGRGFGSGRSTVGIIRTVLIPGFKSYRLWDGLVVCVNGSSFGALSGKGSSRRSTWRNWFSRLWSFGDGRRFRDRFIGIITLTQKFR